LKALWYNSLTADQQPCVEISSVEKQGVWVMKLYPPNAKSLLHELLADVYTQKAENTLQLCSQKAYPFCVKNTNVYCWRWNILIFY
jgi:hypothetical protein